MDTESNLLPGVYQLTVSDQNGCTIDTSFTINESTILSIAIDSTDALCASEASGSAVATPLNGTWPYTYAWSNGQSDSVVTNLTTGNYSVTVTDANGCSGINLTSINAPDLLNLSESIQAISCFGDSDGSISVSVSGGIVPYAYTWQGSTSTDPAAQGLESGNYSITVTDRNGCTIQDSFQVIQPDEILLNPSAIPVECQGQANGQAQVNPTGGTSPYFFQWSNGQQDSIATNLGIGTYTVTVTDANGCTNTDNVLIDEPNALSLTETIQPPTCFGDSNGSISVSISGGTLPYAYNWQGSTSTDPVAQGLSAGNYSITVTDRNGCTIQESFQVIQPDSILLTSTLTPATCQGEATGQALVDPIGGTPPYSYLWTTGATTQMVTDLPAETYTVTVTDANNCTNMDDVLIEEPNALTIVKNIQAPACFDSSDGSISLSVNGGTPPYEYAWNNGSNTPNLSNLASGTYTVTVTDINDCTLISQSNLSTPPILQASLEFQEPLCFGDSSGSITVLPEGGTPPYDFTWSNGGLGANQIGLWSGSYTITLTDANQCIQVYSPFLGEPSALQASMQKTDPTCANDANGSLLLDIAGGISPYLIEWKDGSSDILRNDLSIGSYEVVILDSNQCAIILQDSLTAPANPTPQIIGDSTFCQGEIGQLFTIKTYEGYDWGVSDNDTLTVSNEGIYFLTVTDNNGCTGEVFTEVLVLENPSAMIDQDVVIGCSALSSTELDGSASLGVDQYQWIGGTIIAGDATAFPSIGSAGIYTLVVTDSNGCTDLETIEVLPFQLTVEASSLQASCFKATDGAIIIDSINGSPPFTFFLNGEEITSESSLANLSVGYYDLLIEDAQECQVELFDLEIIQPDSIEVDIQSDFNAQRNLFMLRTNVNRSESEVDAFFWEAVTPTVVQFQSDNNQPEVSLTTEETAIIQVTITDIDGCQGIDTIQIEGKKLFVPEIITPNNDGINEGLEIPFLYQFDQRQIIIFNRWGVEVWRSDQYEQGEWNGQNMNGQRLPDGVYYYILKFDLPDGVIQQGQITLMR